MKTLLLSMKDVKEVLSIKEVIAAVEEGYIAYNSGKVQQPDIVSMEILEHNGETDIKSCYNKINETISVKVASGFYNNGKNNNLPTMIGTIILFDGKNGSPFCVMDGSLITGIRTGAAGAISSKLLARKDSKIVAVFGGGGQARMQIYALCQVMNIQEVRVYSEYQEELFKYKEDVEANTNVKVIICDTPEKAMKDAAESGVNRFESALLSKSDEPPARQTTPSVETTASLETKPANNAIAASAHSNPSGLNTGANQPPTRENALFSTSAVNFSRTLKCCNNQIPTLIKKISVPALRRKSLQRSQVFRSTLRRDGSL